MSAAAGEESQGLVDVDIAHASALNFAMEQAGVPVISSVRVVNRGNESLEDLELVIRLDPELADTRAHRVGTVRAGDAVELTALDLQFRAGRLRRVLEAERAELAWELRNPTNRPLAMGRGTIEVLAFNEWAGLRAPAALLATFVTPNEPVVAGVLRRVSDRLRAVTGDGAITGYQTRSETRVRAMVQALYETIQTLGISYIAAPASYEVAGQKVRFPEAVLRESLGNCLDLSLLVASCLEQMGIMPLLAIEQGHAFAGAWLADDRFPECVVHDAARIRNTCALGQVVFFDSSAMVQDPPTSFDVAERIAAKNLAVTERFLCVVDVGTARRDRYRPMPLREPLERASTPPTGTASEVARTILEESSNQPVDAVSPPRGGGAHEPSGAQKAGKGAEGPVAQRFRKWREKLLDLSLRNKLLNFRPDTKCVLSLDVPDVARLEDLLSAYQTFDVYPKPTDPRDERNVALVRAHGGDDVRREALLEDLTKGILHCPVEETVLVKNAIHLDRESRTAMQEGGSNVLYVAIGLLRWYEGSSTTERLAPLLLVPVAIEYSRTTRRVRVRHLPEESLPNWTLIEKMRVDFGVDLSCLANVEPDESGLDVPAMLRCVREAIQRTERWEVLGQAHLALFSFTKHLMWRDLVENTDVLLENDVIRHIATGGAQRSTTT